MTARISIPELPTEENLKPVLAELPKPYFPLVRAGVANKSGRVYTKECLERAMADFLPRVQQKTVLIHEHNGRGDVPWRPELGNAVAMVKDAHFDGDAININVEYIDRTWKMCSRVVPMSFSVEASCAGSGSEVYEMKIHTVVIVPKPVEHLL